MQANWLLLTQRAADSLASATDLSNSRVDTNADATSTSECKGIYIMEDPSVIGCSGPDSKAALSIDDGTVAPQHARVWRTSVPCDVGTSGSAYEYHVQDLGSNAGTFVNGKLLPQGGQAKLQPGDVLEFGRSPAAEVYKVKMQHVSLHTDEISGHAFTTLVVGKPSLAKSMVAV